MAEAYVAKTADPIVATDQTSETFQASLDRPRRHMRSHSPARSVLPQYAAAGEYSCYPERPASGQKSAGTFSFSKRIIEETIHVSKSNTPSVDCNKSFCSNFGELLK
jgi:hypothetical protein